MPFSVWETPAVLKNPAVIVKAFLTEPAPRLQYDSKRATIADATHRDKYVILDLRPWSAFDDNIKALGDMVLENTKKPPFSVPESFQDPSLWSTKDHAQCGDELSVQSRIYALINLPIDMLLSKLDRSSKSGSFETLDPTARKLAKATPIPVQVSAEELSAFFAADADKRKTRVLPQHATRTRSHAINLSTKPEPSGPPVRKQPDTESRSIPDIVMWTRSGSTPILVAEVKTPWKHFLNIFAGLHQEGTPSKLIRRSRRVFGKLKMKCAMLLVGPC